MKKVNLKACLIAAFCLIVFACFTQAQLQSTEPNETTKPDSNEIELEKREKHLRFQKKKTIKGWRQLKPAMTEKQVQKILSRPKLIQSGSHECVWFYQDIPVSNSRVKYTYRYIRDEYGKIIKTIITGISNVGEVKCGIVFFEAKSIDSLIAEEKAKRYNAILEERAKCHKAIASYHVPRIRNYGGPWRDPPDAREKRAKVEEAIWKRYGEAVKKIENDYNRRVKKLRHNPRPPEFALRFFNQPDWNRFGELSADKETSRIKTEKPVHKWKEPKRWRKLKINMSVKQVNAILGELEGSITRVEGTVKCYGDVPGHGELFFPAHSDLEEYLDSWIEPFWPAVEKSLHDENRSDTKPKD